MTVDDVMLFGKVYQMAVSRMYNELPVRVTPCSCGADVDQQCSFNGRRGVVPHADRRDAAQCWKKENSAEYEELKQGLIRYHVECIIREIRGVGTA